MAAANVEIAPAKSTTLENFANAARSVALKLMGRFAEVNFFIVRIVSL